MPPSSPAPAPSTSTSTELAIVGQNDESVSALRLVIDSIKGFFGIARSNIYDLCIVHVTHIWYQTMLEELEEGAVVLDVGIGTATALVKNRSLLLRKNIRVIGIDRDADYVAAARMHIADASIENCVRVYHHDVYDLDSLKGRIVLPHGASVGGFKSENPADVRFDAIFFSGTFTLLRDKVGVVNALQRDWANQTDGCKIMIAQAYQRTTPPMARLFKRLLKYFTSVDHGELVTESEAKVLFEKKIRKDCKLKVTYHDLIDDSIDNALEAAYLTILEKDVVGGGGGANKNKK